MKSLSYFYGICYPCSPLKSLIATEFTRPIILGKTWCTMGFIIESSTISLSNYFVNFSIARAAYHYWLIKEYTSSHPNGEMVFKIFCIDSLSWLLWIQTMQSFNQILEIRTDSIGQAETRSHEITFNQKYCSSFRSSGGSRISPFMHIWRMDGGRAESEPIFEHALLNVKFSLILHLRKLSTEAHTAIVTHSIKPGKENWKNNGTADQTGQDEQNVSRHSLPDPRHGWSP